MPRSRYAAPAMRNLVLRWSLALAGMALWLAYPFVFQAGGLAVHRYRCSRMPWIHGEDPCFTDYIPVAEIAAFLLTLALAYAFARFAFTLFAPPPFERGRGWRLAASSAAWTRYPALQIAAAAGIGWALLHARTYPIALYPYWIYWAAWIAWFALGIGLSWPPKEQDLR
jgi:hypothetical protein